MITLLLFTVKNFRVCSDLTGKGELLKAIVWKEIGGFGWRTYKQNFSPTP